MPKILIAPELVTAVSKSDCGADVTELSLLAVVPQEVIIAVTIKAAAIVFVILYFFIIAYPFKSILCQTAEQCYPSQHPF